MPPTLVACPSCSCHARACETVCPHCGEPLRRWDGTIPRTAAAALLGLAVAGMAGCGDRREEPAAPAYGVAMATAYGVAASVSAVPEPAPTASAPKDGGR